MDEHESVGGRVGAGGAEPGSLEERPAVYSQRPFSDMVVVTSGANSGENTPLPVKLEIDENDPVGRVSDADPSNHPKLD